MSDVYPIHYAKDPTLSKDDWLPLCGNTSWHFIGGVIHIVQCEECKHLMMKENHDPGTTKQD